MAKLRFFARDDAPDGPKLVAIPGARPTAGQPPRYVARELRKAEDGSVAFVASDTPYECDENSEAGRRLIERIRNDVRDGYGAPLVPGDAYTAQACGLEFKGAKSASTATTKSAARATEKDS